MRTRFALTNGSPSSQAVADHRLAPQKKRTSGNVRRDKRSDRYGGALLRAIRKKNKRNHLPAARESDSTRTVVKSVHSIANEVMSNKWCR